MVNWSLIGGGGERAWIQYADRQNKTVIELRPCFKEPDFPGYLNFIQPLSSLENIPASWRNALRASKGIYLLTCPTSKELYVGSASGEEGFWGRWMDYFNSGHGGNTGLIKREKSDYQISILEVTGSSLDHNELLRKEEKWKLKLQSREMGLNRN